MPVLGAGTDGFVVRAVAQRSGYSGVPKLFRDSVNDSEREIQALQAIGRHSHVVELLKVYAPFGARTLPVLAFPSCTGPWQILHGGAAGTSFSASPWLVSWHSNVSRDWLVSISAVWCTET